MNVSTQLELLPHISYRAGMSECFDEVLETLALRFPHCFLDLMLELIVLLTQSMFLLDSISLPNQHLDVVGEPRLANSLAWFSW